MGVGFKPEAFWKVTHFKRGFVLLIIPLAVCCVRDIEKVFVFDHYPACAAKFAEEMAGEGESGSIPKDIVVCKSSKEAVSQADIVCTATTSQTPVFQFSDGEVFDF